MAWGVKGPHRALPCSGRRKVAGSLLVSQERGPPSPWDGMETRRKGLGWDCHTKYNPNNQNGIQDQTSWVRGWGGICTQVPF